MKNINQLRTVGTCVITILIICLLGWQYFNGGVPAHHFLQRADMPAISNWWGLLIIPLLGWITLAKIQRRIATSNNKLYSLLLFMAGLLFGIAIAFSFLHNYQPFLDNVPYVLLALGLLLPIFWSEFILSFVLAMLYTFGPVLPTIFVLVIAGIGWVLFKLSRLVLQKILKRNQG